MNQGQDYIYVMWGCYLQVIVLLIGDFSLKMFCMQKQDPYWPTIPTDFLRSIGISIANGIILRALSRVEGTGVLYPLSIEKKGLYYTSLDCFWHESCRKGSQGCCDVHEILLYGHVWVPCEISQVWGILKADIWWLFPGRMALQNEHFWLRPTTSPNNPASLQSRTCVLTC